MEVHKLPPDVQSILQSGIVISDATQCVLELVYNALDAKATSIAIRVNLTKFYVQVVDNGSGLTKEDLSLLGERHMTSKCSTVDNLENIIYTFGYRGSALASIADVCNKVEIQSKHSSGNVTYTKLIINGRSEPVERSKCERPIHGTTVTVCDLMASMPVRRKRIKEVFDLDDIQHQVEALAVIHSLVSFSLRNDVSGKVLLQTHRRDDPVLTLSELFGLAVGVLLIPIRCVLGRTIVSGVVCRQLHSDATLQLVYVNNRIIQKSRVHKLVIDLIKKYGNVWAKDRDNSQEIVDVDGYVFIVKILCPYQSVAFTRNGRKTSVEFRNAEEILKCVHRAVKGSLKDENADSSLQNGSWWVGPENSERGKGNPGFGPSQLKNVVRGQRVLRMIKNSEGALLEVIPNDTIEKEVGERTGKRESNIVREREVLKELSQNNVEQRQTKKSMLLLQENEARSRFLQERNQKERPFRQTPCPSDVIQRYCEAFFYESSREGTALAENAPIFEIEGFSEIPFHDFLAWLKVKANDDPVAMKLVTEFSNLKTGRTAPSASEPLPVLSLKDIRKEKFALRSRLMLKRIEKVADTKQTFSQSENKENECPGTFKHPVSVSRKVVHRETTTYTRTPSWPTDGQDRQALCVRGKTQEVPQVSFNEFLTWLKFRASNDNATNRILNEFLAFKFRRTLDHPKLPLVSLKDARREKLALRSRQLLSHIRENAVTRKETRQITCNYSEETERKSRSEFEQRREGQDEQTKEVVNCCRYQEARRRNPQKGMRALKEIEKKPKRSHSPKLSREEGQPARKRQCGAEKFDEIHRKGTRFEKVKGKKTKATSRKQRSLEQGPSGSPPENNLKRKVLVPEAAESPFFTTWNSHYRDGNDPHIQRIEKILEGSSVPATEQSLGGVAMIEEELKEMNRRDEAVTSPKFIASTNTVVCKEMLIPSQPSSVVSEPLCSDVPEFDEEVCRKAIEGGGHFQIPVYSTLNHFSDHPHIQLESSIKYLAVEHKETQVCPVTNHASTQVFIKAKKLATVAVQTSPASHFVGSDKQVQVSQHSQPVEEVKVTPLSGDVIFLSQPQSKNTEELPCGQQPGVRANGGSSETPLPEVLRPNPESEEAEVNVLDEAPIVYSTPDTKLPDTVPLVPGDHWEERKDELGRSFFVHSPSGFTAFNPPASSTRSSFPLRSSVWGASQPESAEMTTLEQRGRDEVRAAVTASCEDYLGNIKWSGNGDGTERPRSGEPLLKALENAAGAKSHGFPQEGGILSAKLTKQAAAVHGMLSSFVFTKESLQGAKVVGQLDRKFIVALLTKPQSESEGKPQIICLFDQHAVHERITVENLLEQHQKLGEREALESPLVLPASPATVNVAKFQESHFAAHGLSVVPHSANSLLINAVPACFLRRQRREVKAYRQSSLKRLVTDLVEELTEHLTATRGAGLTIPKTIMAVIATEACRSSIKFNKVLCLEEMVDMLSELRQCQLPFQCAHGRPSVVPVFQMEPSRLQTEQTKLNLKKFKKKKNS